MRLVAVQGSASSQDAAKLKRGMGRNDPDPAGMSTLVSLLSAAGLGLLSAAGYAPLAIWPLMLIALAGLLLVLDRTATVRTAAACGWVFGFTQSIVALSWVAISFEYQANMPRWLGPLGVVALSAYVALYPALALALASKLWSRSPTRIPLLAVCWAAAEWLRGHLFTGFPWNMVAQVWADTPLMIQSVRLVGAYGLSLMTVALFASVALLRKPDRGAQLMLLIMTSLAALLLLDGWWRLQCAAADAPTGTRLHLIQANIRQSLETDPARQAEILEHYERASAAALAANGPGLVIWPETALEQDVERDPVLRSRIAGLIDERSFVIGGAVGQRLDVGGRWLGARNSLFAIDARGEIRAVYDKARLVPFGEYLPAADRLAGIGLQSVAGGTARFVAGSGPASLKLDAVPSFAPAICYEIIFPEAFVSRRDRPEWILNISNDAWFGRSWGPYQHFAQARLRAVEEGLPVVRATPTGVSGIIDAYGRVVTRSALGERAILSALLPRALPETLYVMFGPRPSLVLVAAFAAAALVGRRAVRGVHENQPRLSA